MRATARRDRSQARKRAATLWLALLPVLAVLAFIGARYAAASGPIPITNCSNDQQIQQDAAQGGSYYFSVNCSVTLSKPLTVDSNLSLNADGHTAYLFSGTGYAYRVFNVNSGNLTLTGVQLNGSIYDIGGSGANGGTGANGGSGFSAGPLRGGAMSISPGAHVTLSGGAVRGVLKSEGGSGGNGGAQSSATSAGTDGGGAGDGGNVQGGAIYVAHGATLTVVHAPIYGSATSMGGSGGRAGSALCGPPDGTGGSGGKAGNVSGGAIYNAGTVTLENSLVTGTADSTAGSGGGGGGPPVNHYCSPAPPGGVAGNGGSSGAALGAGIYNSGTLSLNAVSLESNDAWSDAGAGGGSGYGPPGNGGSSGPAEGGAVYSTTSPLKACVTFSSDSVSTAAGAPGEQEYGSMAHGKAGTKGVASGPDTYGATFPACLIGLSVGNTRVLEPKSGSSTDARFEVTLSSSYPSAAVSVHYSTANGTATAAHGDYKPTSGTLTFPAGGALTESVLVPVHGTGLKKHANFYLVLSNPSGATLTKSKGTATIEPGP